MGSRVEQFEQIRRDRDREGLSIRVLAQRHGVHRRAVRQALASSVPPVKRAAVQRSAARLGGYRGLIDEWLVADLEAPRKQRHTAKRVWRRLVDEHGLEVAEWTVRDHVRRRRRELGQGPAEVFVPQIHASGQTAEVDWGEADVDLAGARTPVHLFFMRSCFSGTRSRWRRRWRPSRRSWRAIRRRLTGSTACSARSATTTWLGGQAGPQGPSPRGV